MFKSDDGIDGRFCMLGEAGAETDERWIKYSIEENPASQVPVGDESRYGVLTEYGTCGRSATHSDREQTNSEGGPGALT